MMKIVRQIIQRLLQLNKIGNQLRKKYFLAQRTQNPSIGQIHKRSILAKTMNNDCCPINLTFCLNKPSLVVFRNMTANYVTAVHLRLMGTLLFLCLINCNKCFFLNLYFINDNLLHVVSFYIFFIFDNQNLFLREKSTEFVQHEMLRYCKLNKYMNMSNWPYDIHISTFRHSISNFDF